MNLQMSRSRSAQTLTCFSPDRWLVSAQVRLNRWLNISPHRWWNTWNNEINLIRTKRNKPSERQFVWRCFFMGILIEKPVLVTCILRPHWSLLRIKQTLEILFLNAFSFLTVFHAPLHFTQNDITWLNPFCSSRKESVKFTVFFFCLLCCRHLRL